MNSSDQGPNGHRRLPKLNISTLFQKAVSRLSRRARIVLLIVGAGLLIAAAGLIYYERIYVASQAAAESPLHTATVKQGDLVISATGSGTLIAKQEVDLAFQTAGKVTELNVKVGDQVEVGEVLAKVDDTDEKIAYAEAKRALDELTSAASIATAKSDVATAQGDLDDAIQHLEYILSPGVFYWERQIEQAQQKLHEAQAAAAASPSDQQAQTALQIAQAALEHAQVGMVGAKAGYDNYVKKYFTYMIMDYTTGKKTKYVSEPTNSDILSARAAVAEAESALQEAEWYYAALTGGDVPENATGSNLTAREKAQLDLNTAENDLDGTALTATIGGTVMSVDTIVGDTVAKGATVTKVSNLSDPYIEVFLDESDWGIIKQGAQADVTFDILPDQAFTGQVAQVDPGLYDESGTTVVRAYVDLVDIDKSSFSLPLGSAATVEVIWSKVENAILVPLEALHKTESGQYTVFVLESGTPKLRVIQVGIQDLIYAQVTSGLEAGEVVTTGITETK